MLSYILVRRRDDESSILILRSRDLSPEGVESAVAFGLARDAELLDPETNAVRLFGVLVDPVVGDTPEVHLSMDIESAYVLDLSQPHKEILPASQAL